MQRRNRKRNRKLNAYREEVKRVLRSERRNHAESLELATKWSESILDPKERSDFLKALGQTSLHWDTSYVVVKLKEILSRKENATLCLLIQQLPIPVFFKNRKSMEYMGTDLVEYGDDFRQRYLGLMNKLRVNNNPQYRDSLLFQERKRWACLKLGPYVAFDCYDYKMDADCKSFEEFPLDELEDGRIGTFHVILELAFDILTQGWDKIKRDASFYYRVRFASLY